MLYSASIASYIEHLPMRWKTLLAYLLTDELMLQPSSIMKKEELTVNESLVLFRRGIGIVDNLAGQHCAGNLFGRGDSIIVGRWTSLRADVHRDGGAGA